MLHFDYIEPTTFEKAAVALSDKEVTAKIIAGGTDVLVQIRQGKLAPDRLVSLGQIPGLCHINLDQQRISIGATTTIRQLETSDLIRQYVPILFDAVERLGSVQIRNVATLGGNICNAAPSADTIPALLALKAEVSYWSSSQTKTCTLQKFFVGPGKTMLQNGEIVISIGFQKPHPRSAGAYLKSSRRKGMDLPLLGIAVHLQMDEDLSRCEDVTIALGVAAPTPIRVTGAEEALKGEKITEGILSRVSARASEEAKPRDSFRCSAEYRRAMIRNLLPGVIETAFSRIAKSRENEK